MPPADPSLAVLVDRFRALPPAEQRQVLARLSPAECDRLDAALQGATPRFAADIAERIAAPPGDGRMTAAARDALLTVAARSAPRPPLRAAPAASLFERIGGWIGRR